MTTRAALQDWLTTYRQAGAASGAVYTWGTGGDLAADVARTWTWKAHNGRWTPVGPAPIG